MIHPLLSRIKFLFLCLLIISANIYSQTTDPSINLLSPNGGEYWTTGSFPHITWKTSDITVVKIEISFDGGIIWETISPAAVAIYGYYSSWQIGDIQSNQCLIKISKYDDPDIYDVSESYFTIVKDSSLNTLVVLGSSTAAGVGPSSIDSAWVTKYRNYLFERNTTVKVINLAVGGYTTYDIMPTGFIPPENRPLPKTASNISKAVDYDPKAIIINLPSNDVNMGYTINEQLSNYDTILSVSNQYNIPLWVSTTQPRNFSAAQIQQQIEMRDSTFSRFGDKAIDFWTGIADSNGRIDPEFNSGDGIHLNDKGHAILFSRVLEANIFDPIVLAIESYEFELSQYELKQNYPNPFNPSTKIQFSLSEAGQYSLKVYNVLGQEVQTLVEHYLQPGIYEIDFDGKELSSGVYIYTLFGDNKLLSKKMILMK